MSVSNLTALCFAMGKQGGTVHQVARDLGVDVNDIINADETRMDDLLRMAQAHGRKVPADRAAALDAANDAFYHVEILELYANGKPTHEINGEKAVVVPVEHIYVLQPLIRTLKAALMQPAPVEKVEGLAEAIDYIENSGDVKVRTIAGEWKESSRSYELMQVCRAARLQLARQEGK